MRETIFAENYEESIQYKILETTRKLLKENMHVIGVIFKTIHLCGKQVIVLRGHRDDYSNDFANKGSLMTIISF